MPFDRWVGAIGAKATSVWSVRQLGHPGIGNPEPSLKSTCWIASDIPPNQGPDLTNAPIGRVRPAPARLDTLYNPGAPKNWLPVSRAPKAGLPKGSWSESSTAIETPPIPSRSDGKMSNWWAWEIGTVRMVMIWAATGATHAATRAAENGMARFSMLHLVRELGSDVNTSAPIPSSPPGPI